MNFGGAACDSCHGYPPTGKETPAPFLDHGSRSPGVSTGENFLSAHDDCSICHGVRGNTSSPPDGFVYTDLTALGGDAYTADAAQGRFGADQRHQFAGQQAERRLPDFQRRVRPGLPRRDLEDRRRLSHGAGKSLREFGSGSCETCHGGGIAAEGSANFWPDGLGVAPKGNQYPNRPGWHTKHINAVAVARYGATPTTEQKNTTCDTCHPDPGSVGHDDEHGRFAGEHGGRAPGSAEPGDALQEHAGRGQRRAHRELRQQRGREREEL